MTRGEWISIGAMAAVVVALHAVGWVTLAALVAPHHYPTGGSGAFGLGLGLTAYTLGMRHAFDADHIAAIDNTTRKLLAEGKKPVTVGFWFSLGHSTVVFGLCVLLAFGIRSLAGQIGTDDSTLQSVTSVFGTLVSGTFLYVLGIVNLVILVGILKVFRDMRRGTYD
jgi:nickel/cobalt transporter (NiCoT) family protein